MRYTTEDVHIWRVVFNVTMDEHKAMRKMKVWPEALCGSLSSQDFNFNIEENVGLRCNCKNSEEREMLIAWMEKVLE